MKILKLLQTAQRQLHRSGVYSTLQIEQLRRDVIEVHRKLGIRPIISGNYLRNRAVESFELTERLLFNVGVQTILRQGVLQFNWDPHNLADLKSIHDLLQKRTMGTSTDIDGQLLVKNVSRLLSKLQSDIAAYSVYRPMPDHLRQKAGIFAESIAVNFTTLFTPAYVGIIQQAIHISMHLKNISAQSVVVPCRLVKSEGILAVRKMAPHISVHLPTWKDLVHHFEQQTANQHRLVG